MLARKLPDAWEQKLLDRLNSPDPECSVEAVRRLRALDPEQVASLVRRAARMQTPWIRRTALLALVPALVAGVLAAQTGTISAPVMLNVVIAGAALLLTSVVVFRLAPGRNMSESFSLLAVHIGAQADVSALPWLLGLLEEEMEHAFPLVLRRGLRTGLAKILPSVTDVEFGMLRSIQRDLLAGLLRTPYEDVRLTVAAIDLMARLADPFGPGLRARLQMLARQGTVTANMRHVRESAQKALAQLEARRARYVQSQSLLRAADGLPPGATDELLRPTSHVAAVPPEQMVRASASPEEPGASIARQSELG